MGLSGTQTLSGRSSRVCLRPKFCAPGVHKHRRPLCSERGLKCSRGQGSISIVQPGCTRPARCRKRKRGVEKELTGRETELGRLSSSRGADPQVFGSKAMHSEMGRNGGIGAWITATGNLPLRSRFPQPRAPVAAAQRSRWRLPLPRRGSHAQPRNDRAVTSRCSDLPVRPPAAPGALGCHLHVHAHPNSEFAAKWGENEPAGYLASLRPMAGNNL
jgi:hypothetical protein